MLHEPTRELNFYNLIKHTLPPYPRQVRLETSSLCNSSCPWCHFHGEKGGTRPKGRMSIDLVKAVVEDIATWPEPLKELSPTNFGEAQMHGQWFEIFMFIAEKLPKTGIAMVTTGSLMTPDYLEKLCQVPTLSWVNFSINSFFAETWERQTNLPRKLMLRAVQAVHAFRDRRPDVKVNVSMVYDTELVTEFERDLFLDYWSKLGGVTINERSYAGWPGRGPKAPVTLPCRSIADGLVVFDNGDVSHGCCFNGDNDPELRIGAVPEERLLDIWRGEKLARFLELHNSGRRAEIGLCRGCTFA